MPWWQQNKLSGYWAMSLLSDKQRLMHHSFRNRACKTSFLAGALKCLLPKPAGSKIRRLQKVRVVEMECEWGDLLESRSLAGSFDCRVILAIEPLSVAGDHRLPLSSLLGMCER